MNQFKNILIKGVQIKRLNVFVLFFVMALTISVLAKFSDRVTQTLSLELVPVQLNPTELITDSQPQFMDVTVETDGYDMLKYAFQHLTYKIDVTTLDKSNSTYTWTADLKDFKGSDFFDESFEIIALSPKVVRFNYDTQSQKRVPVTVVARTQFSVGYDMLNPLTSRPDSITIVGAKTSLDTIDRISTLNIEMTAIKSDINQSVELRIPPNLKPSSNVVQVFGTVEKFTEGKLNVPVSVVNLPEGFTVSIFPKEIPVVYYTNLRTYDSITATDFKVVCDFNNFNIDSKVLVPTLASHPKSIKNASLEINKLEFVMTKKND